MRMDHFLFYPARLMMDATSYKWVTRRERRIVGKCILGKRGGGGSGRKARNVQFVGGRFFFFVFLLFFFNYWRAKATRNGI